jgi:hypothetical protein
LAAAATAGALLGASWELVPPHAASSATAPHANSLVKAAGRYEDVWFTSRLHHLVKVADHTGQVIYSKTLPFKQSTAGAFSLP